MPVDEDLPGRAVRLWNWDVIFPLFAHYYPGRFSGIGEVIKQAGDLGQQLERIENWIALLCELIAPNDNRVRELAVKIRPARAPQSPEHDFLNMTPHQQQAYIGGIGEIMKFGPFVDSKKTPRPQLILTLWEQDFESMIREAKRHYLRVPDIRKHRRERGQPRFE